MSGETYCLPVRGYAAYPHWKPMILSQIAPRIGAHTVATEVKLVVPEHVSVPTNKQTYKQDFAFPEGLRVVFNTQSKLYQ